MTYDAAYYEMLRQKAERSWGEKYGQIAPLHEVDEFARQALKLGAQWAQSPSKPTREKTMSNITSLQYELKIAKRSVEDYERQLADARPGHEKNAKRALEDAQERVANYEKHLAKAQEVEDTKQLVLENLKRIAAGKDQAAVEANNRLYDIVTGRR